MKYILFLFLLPLTLFGQSQKISDMTSATTLDGTELVPIVQTTNKKSTVSLLRGWSSGTANTITYWPTTTTLGSLSTATYPSLTELSYVKGVTSAVQTQIDTKWGLSGTSSITGNTVINDPTQSYNLNIGSGMGNNPLGIYITANSTAYIGRQALNYLEFSSSGTKLLLGSDATGDTYYRNSSGYFTRLAAGTDGHVLTLASGIPSWAAPSGGSGLTVGTSTITSGTNTRVLYNNSGVLGEYTVSGSGNVAMTTSPTFTTPNIGTATGTADGDWHLTGTSTLTGAVDIVGTSSNTIKHTFNSLGVTQTNGAGLHFRNTTAAAAGAQQMSPSIVLEGNGWKTNATAASQSVKYIMDVLPVQGAANPTGTFRIGYSINGAATTYAISFDQSNSYLYVPNLVATSGIIQLNSSRIILFNGGLGSIRSDANTGLEFKANSTSTVITGGQYRFYNINNYTATSGTQNVIANETGFAPTSGTAAFNAYLQSGTINQTGGANGRVTLNKLNPTFTAAADVVGYDYAPVSGTPSAELSYRATQGKVLFGGSTITASTYHDFRGGSSTDKILRLADGSNNELFTFKADKEYEVTQANGKYQERQPTGTTSATVYSENIYSSSDISDGQSVTIEVLWTAKDSGANTGAGGIFYTTWTKASGTLAKAGDNQLVTNDNMTGSWALSTSDSGGSIALAFTGTGVANTEISLVTRIIKSN